MNPCRMQHRSPRLAAPRSLTRRLLLPLLVLAIAGVPGIAAAASSASSSAYGLAVDVRAAAARVQVGPEPAAGGQAPQPYDRRESAARAEAASSTLGVVARTGLVQVEASGTPPQGDTARARAAVHELEALTEGLVRLEAAEVVGSAAIGGSCGSSLQRSAETILVGARLDVGGPVPASVRLDGRPAPNTTVFDQLGVRVVLNEQSAGGDGRSAFVSVNAIHVYLDGAQLGLERITGDFVVSHAEAALRCDLASATDADLEVSQSTDRPHAVPGQPLVYEIRVHNAGPGAAPGARAIDTLPGEVTLESASPSQGSCSRAGVLACELGTLPAGGTTTIQVRVRVSPGASGTLSNRVEISSGAPDPDPSDNVSVLLTPVDRDGDGLPDGEDNCPANANRGQADGDRDGAGDACDNCPSAPNAGQGDADGDGRGDACDGGDADRDGIPDEEDNCPATPNADQADGDGDGTGDTCDPDGPGDGDADGVPDVLDNCPGTGNPQQEDADGDGIGDACEELCPSAAGGEARAGTLSLASGRVLVEVSGQTRAGRKVALRGAALGEGGGYFWSGARGNVELAVRASANCARSGQLRVDLSGMTGLGLVVRVTDVASGKVWVVQHRAGELFLPASTSFACSP